MNACYSTPRLTTAGWGLSYWGQRWAGRDRALSAGEEETIKPEAGQLRPLSCMCSFPGNSPVWAGLSLFSSQAGPSESPLPTRAESLIWAFPPKSPFNIQGSSCTPVPQGRHLRTYPFPEIPHELWAMPSLQKFSCLSPKFWLHLSYLRDRRVIFRATDHPCFIQKATSQEIFVFTLHISGLISSLVQIPPFLVKDISKEKRNHPI